MKYPGGKNGAGVYQTIINLMPPHDTYIEPFLGSGAILRMKRPAKKNIGVDLDPEAVKAFTAEVGRADPLAISGDVGSYTIIHDDAFSFLQSYSFGGDELIYCDPPYMHETRSRTDVYRCEMSRDDHIRLIDLLLSLRSFRLLDKSLCRCPRQLE